MILFVGRVAGAATLRSTGITPSTSIANKSNDASFLIPEVALASVWIEAEI
jgi:hypothetical protein